MLAEVQCTLGEHQAGHSSLWAVRPTRLSWELTTRVYLLLWKVALGGRSQPVAMGDPLVDTITALASGGSGRGDPILAHGVTEGAWA